MVVVVVLHMVGIKALVKDHFVRHPQTQHSRRTLNTLSLSFLSPSLTYLLEAQLSKHEFFLYSSLLPTMTWPKFSSYGVKNKLLYQGFFFLEICIQPWKNTKMDRTDVHIAHISYQWECLLPGGDQQITPSFLPLGSKWIRIVRLLNGLRWPQLYQKFFATELFRFSMLHGKKKCIYWTALRCGVIFSFDLRLSDQETLFKS